MFDIKIGVVKEYNLEKEEEKIKEIFKNLNIE